MVDQAPAGAADALAVLGLSTAEETAYRLLIRRGAATLAEVATEWPAGNLDDSARIAVRRLLRRGLAYRLPGRPARYAAVSPRMVFDPALAEQASRLRAAREHAEQLARSYRSPAWTTESGIVEVVTGRVVLRERLSRALRSTRVELRSVVVDPAEHPALVDAERELRGRTVTTRVQCRPEGRAAAPRQWRRTADDVPASLHLVDDRLAFVLSSDRGDSAIVVHPCELLTVLSLLFEALWERSGSPPHDAETDRLVDLLLSGLTDAGIGRALGVSTRTAQRRVATLMQAAGARTRFQAGVQAALRQL